jgi:hypothetical protein
LSTCVQHIRSLLEDIETLQQALEIQRDGDDHSKHQVALLVSYFQARQHFDGVLFNGKPAAPAIAGTGFSLQISSTMIKEKTVTTMTNSTLDDNTSRQETLAEDGFEKAIQNANDKTRAVEREILRSIEAPPQSPVKLQDTLGRRFVVPSRCMQDVECKS